MITLNTNEELREKGLKALDPSTQSTENNNFEGIPMMHNNNEHNPLQDYYVALEPEDAREKMPEYVREQRFSNELHKEENSKNAKILQRDFLQSQDPFFNIRIKKDQEYATNLAATKIDDIKRQRAEALNLSVEEFDSLGLMSEQEMKYIYAQQYNQKSIEKRIQTEVAKGKNLPKVSQPDFKLSQDVWASYYTGVESLDNDIIQQLNAEWGESFKNADEDLKNFYLKAHIVKDLCENSDDPNLQQWWEQNAPYVTPNNQEALDTIFDYYYAINKSDRFQTAPWYTGYWRRAVGTTDMHSKPIDDMPSFDDPDKWEKQKKREQQIQEAKDKNRITNPSILNDTEKQVYKNLDSRSELLRGQFRNHFDALSDVEKETALNAFKEHSRQISPTKFGEFEGTDKIPLSDENYYDLIAKYNSDMKTAGSQYADTRLQNYYQDLVAKHTNMLENCGTTISQWAMNAVTSSAGTLASAAVGAGTMMQGEGFERGWDHSEFIQYLMKTYNTLDIEDAYAKWKNGIGPTNVVQTTVEEDNSYLSWATPYALAEQSGYIAGFVLGGKGTSAILGGGAKIVNGAIKGSKLFNLTSKTKNIGAHIIKGIEKGAAISTMVVQSAANANMEAADVKYSFLGEATAQLQKNLENQFIEDLNNRINQNPDYWAGIYFNRTAIPLGDLLINKESQSQTGKKYSEKDIRTLVEYFAKDQGLKEEYKKINQDKFNRDLIIAEAAASEGAKTTWGIEMATELIINSTLRKSLLPPSVARAFSSKTPFKKLVDITFDKTGYNVSSKVYTKLAAAGTYVDRAIGEFFDEYGEALGGSFGSSYARSALEDMQMSAYANHSTNAALDYDVLHAAASGFESATAEMFSKETLQSGLYGALASLMGLPGFKSNAELEKMSSRREGESWLDFAKRNNPFMWDSVFTLPFSDSAIVEENKKRDGIRDFIASYLQDPEKLAMFMHAGKAASYTQQLHMAEATGDEKAIRDARANLLREQVTFLASMEGTVYHDNLMQILQNRANLNKENLKDPNSEESKAVQEYYSEGSNNKILKPEEALEEIINSAEKMLSMVSAAKIEISNIKNIHGEDIDIEFLNDQVKNRLLLRDRKRRIEGLNKKIEEQVSLLNLDPDTQRSKWSANAKTFIARYGDRYYMDSQGNKILPAEQYLQAQKQQAVIYEQQILDAKNLTKSQKKKAISSINKKIAKLDKEIVEYKKEAEQLQKADKILSAQEIMELPVHERAAFVSSDSHSKEQKKEIKKLDSLIRDLVDLSRLQADYDKALKVETEIMTDYSSLADYHAKVHKKALKSRIQSKYAYLNNDNYTYDEFKSEYYKAYNETIESKEDAELLLETIKDSPHYKEFETELKNFTRLMMDITQTSKFKELLKDKKAIIRANIFAALNYFHQNGISININDNIDTIIDKLSSIPQQEWRKHLKNQETIEGEFHTLPIEDIAANLKTLYDNVIEDKKIIEERNKEYKNVSAETADNNPSTPSTTSTSEERPSKTNTLMQDITSKATKFKDSDFTKKAAKKHRSNKQIVDKRIDDIIDKVNNSVKENPDTDIKRAIDLEVSAISNLREKGAVLEVFDAIFKAEDSNEDQIENRPQPVKIEGFSQEESEFMRTHRSFSTLATTDSTVGTPIYFYTPKSLLKEGDELPIVVMIENPKDGSIVVKGKKYSPVGILEEPTQAMLDENKDRSGDFMYSQEATISTLQKEGFKPDYFGQDIPVRDAIGSRSIDDIVDKVRVETKIVDENPQKQVVFPLTRGRVRSESQEGYAIPIEFHNTAPSKVKNKNGQTIFDVLSEFKQAKEAEQRILDNPESSKEEKEKAREEKNKAASKVLNYNSYISDASTVLNDFNQAEGPIVQLLENPNQDMSKFTKKINWTLSNHIYIPDGYTIGIMNPLIDAETGTLSFDIVLNYPHKGGYITLHSVNGLSRQKRMSHADIATILYNLATDSEGKPRMHNDRLLFRYQVSYTRTTKDGKEKVNKSAIRTAIEEGVFTTAHKTFDYPANELMVTFKHPVRPVTPQNVETDTSAPTKPSSDNITNNQNETIDPDTGSKVNEQPQSILEIETTGGEVTTEEIIEESQEVESPATDEVDPFADSEEDTSMLEEDNDFDLGEDTEYQLVEARYSLLSKARNYFKSILKSTESKKDYIELNKNTAEEFQNDTKSNAFTSAKSETLKETKVRAEKRASEIRNLKRDNIKSVKVIQTSKNGYSISIEYNSFERYIDRRISNLDTLTNTALVNLVNKFKNKEKVISVSQKEAEKQLSLFEKLKTKELYQAYQEALGTPANTPFEKLLKELLKSYNFTVLEKEIKAVHGNDVAGAMSTLGQIIYLAKGGNRNKLTLAEETAHVLINALTNTDSESNSLLSTYKEIEVLIEDTPFYKETLNQYSKEYINADGEVDLNKVKKEAVGKALAAVLTSKYSSDKTVVDKVIDLFNDLVIAVKAFLQNHKLTEGTEAILHYKLNTLAESLVGKAIKNKKQERTNTIQKIFKAIGIDTKSKHVKSEAEKDVEQRKEALKNSSAVMGFNYEYLNNATKENLLTKGINESAWKNYPLELQEAILKCLAK